MLLIWLWGASVVLAYAIGNDHRLSWGNLGVALIWPLALVVWAVAILILTAFWSIDRLRHGAPVL